jgi:Methane oxygenase PmoA
MLKNARRIVAIIGALATLFFFATGLTLAKDWQLTVKGGEQALGETSIVVPVKSTIPIGIYYLESADRSEVLTAQVFKEGDRHFLATVLPKVAVGRGVSYTLEHATKGFYDSKSGIVFRPDGPNLIVTCNAQFLTTYRVDAGHKPFFFPMFGPTGEPYTRAYPMESVAGEDRDHPHQRSFWFTHGNVNGIDFWAETEKSGRIHETDRQIIVEGPVLGRMRTKDEWLAPDGHKVLDDERLITFYDVKSSRIIDFDIKLEATKGPVTFGDTKEGMFGLRVASTMDVNKKTGGKITNAEGLTDDKAWGQASPWVDYVGPVKEKTVGIAILNRPDSFRYPTTWHVRTYGLFAANPFGWHDFGKPMKGDHTLPAGESISFHYRVILHEGDTNSIELPRLFDAYAKLPTIELTGD